MGTIFLAKRNFLLWVILQMKRCLCALRARTYGSQRINCSKLSSPSVPGTGPQKLGAEDLPFKRDSLVVELISERNSANPEIQMWFRIEIAFALHGNWNFLGVIC